MDRPPSKWLGFGAGFGAGAALMGFVLYAALIWYPALPGLPTPWNANALRASFDKAVYSMARRPGKAESFGIDYVVENRTRRDYLLPAGARLLVLARGRLESRGDCEVFESVLIPAGHKAKCTLKVRESGGKAASGENEAPVDGFVLFDKQNRYKLVFPKPTTKVD